MEITYQHLINYANTSFHWLRKKKENADTKFGYAINRMAKPIEKALKPYKELLEEQQVAVDDVNIKNATTDKDTKVLIYDVAKNEQGQEVRNYKYTADNLIKRNKEIRAILKQYEKIVEDFLETNATLSNPYYATVVPEDLTIQEIEAFSGIIINPTPLKVSSNGVAELQDA